MQWSHYPRNQAMHLVVALVLLTLVPVTRRGERGKRKEMERGRSIGIGIIIIVGIIAMEKNVI